MQANGGAQAVRGSIAALARLTDTCAAGVAAVRLPCICPHLPCISPASPSYLPRISPQVRAELAAEEREDAAMRAKYGDRWEVVASDAMGREAQAELHVCEARLALAADANHQVDLNSNPTSDSNP